MRGLNGEEIRAGLIGSTSIGSGCGSAFVPPTGRTDASTAKTAEHWRTRWLVVRQVRSVFFVGLIPWAFSHALCSACALASAAVLGKLVGLPFGVVMLITRDIAWLRRIRWRAYRFSERMSCS
jgi:hypothetical protein